MMGGPFMAYGSGVLVDSMTKHLNPPWGLVDLPGHWRVTL